MKIPIQLTPELQEKVFFPNFHHKFIILFL